MTLALEGEAASCALSACRRASKGTRSGISSRAANVPDAHRMRLLSVSSRMKVMGYRLGLIECRLAPLLDSRLAPRLHSLVLALLVTCPLWCPVGRPLRPARKPRLPLAHAMRLPALAPLLARGRIDDVDEHARQVEDDEQGGEPGHRGQGRRGRAAEARRRQLEELAELRRAELRDDCVARYEIDPLRQQRQVARRHHAVGIHVGDEAPLPVFPPCNLHLLSRESYLAYLLAVLLPLHRRRPGSAFWSVPGQRHRPRGPSED